MTDIGENIDEESGKSEALIVQVIAELREASETDVALLDILSENILTITPTNTAVNDAVSAIESLATKRAQAKDRVPPD